MSSKLSSLVLFPLVVLAAGGCAPRTHNELADTGDSDLGEPDWRFREGDLKGSAFGLGPKEIVLTFDDGPSSYSIALAENLAAKGIRANWFVNYRNIGNLGTAAGQQAVRRICELGHQVGNHNRAHTYNTNTWAEIKDVHNKIRELCPNLDQLYYRAPGGNWRAADAGHLNPVVDASGKTLASQYIGPVHWDFPCDTQPECNSSDPATLAQRYYNLIVNGGRGIILAHDIHARTVKAWTDPRIDLVGRLRRAGFKFVTLDQNCTKTNSLLGRSTQKCGSGGEAVPGPIECPAGYTLEKVGEGKMCGNGHDAWGPFTEAMKAKCLQWSPNDPACSSDRWGWELAKNARGTELCPVGATFDPETTYCVEGQNAFGPFPAALVAKCEAAQGGSACKSARWGRTFLKGLMER